MGRKKIPRSHWARDKELNGNENGTISLTNYLPKNQTGVKCGIGENGKPYLQVLFSAPEILNPIQTCDCTSWLGFPEIAKPFADAFFYLGRSKRAGTRREMKSCIRRFFDFLEEEVHSQQKRQALSLSYFNIEIINKYIGWLKTKRTNSGVPLHPITKKNYLDQLRRIFDSLAGMKQYSQQIKPNLFLIRSPWPDPRRHRNPRKVLSNDILLRYEKACLDEIDRTMDLLDEGERLVLENRHLIPKTPLSKRDYKDFGVCLAAVLSEFNGIIPSAGTLEETKKHLYNAIRDYHGYYEIVKHLHPTPRTLVPFVLILASRTFFNPDTLLGLTWSQIHEKNWFYGEDRWDIDPLQQTGRMEIHGKKGRSNRLQIRSFPAQVTDPDNPPEVLRKLRRFTARLRPITEPFFADRLFLFVPTSGAVRKPLSYGSNVPGLSSDEFWKRHLKCFIKDHGLPKFSLANFRATGSDLVNELSGGDIKMQQTVLNHREAQTTYRHYSDGPRRIGNEAIAGIQGEQVRWVETKGHRDVRNLIGISTRRAATPGFECFNPFNSPQPNQKDGKMCSAYLACPGCEMAVINGGDAQALALIAKLEIALASAEFEVTPQRWTQELVPILQAIQRTWLPLFPSDTWKAAEKLKSVPDIVVE